MADILDVLDVNPISLDRSTPAWYRAFVPPKNSAAAKLVDLPSLADRCWLNVYVVVSGDGAVAGAFFPAQRTRGSVDRPKTLGFRHTHYRREPLVWGNRVLVNEKSAAHRSVLLRRCWMNP
jgi:hypothetical protein